MGLHESGKHRSKNEALLKFVYLACIYLGSWYLLGCVPPNTGDGKFYGAELVLGVVTQQFQFGGVKNSKRGK